jgi:hemerythrin-like domain-containing protein
MTPRPTHILRHEHRVIEQALRALHGMALKLKLGEPVPVKALAQALDFIRNFADGFHHVREEAHLFPALEAYGLGEAGGALGFLHAEHLRERELLAELELALEEYQQGDAPVAERIVAALEQYANHLLAHIQKEDTLLFRFAEDLLEEEDKTALIQHLSPQANPLQAAIVQKYEQLATHLEQAWAV